MHIYHIVGARPNFMKAAPVMRALGSYPVVKQTLVHTGQHYDKNMSGVFFQQLGLPAPDYNLEVGSGSHAVQTAQIMIGLEQVLLADRPCRVLVYGDVNSTVAAALVCAKLGIPVDHVEAGLRSGDRSMPEEINRLVTDRIADLLFTPSEDGSENLRREGVDHSRIHCVGNVMIDTLMRLLPFTDSVWQQGDISKLRDADFVLVTLHRPSNVDNPSMLVQICAALQQVAKQIPVIFPVHPRTRSRILGDEFRRQFVLDPDLIQMVEPLGYLEFLALQKRAKLVITDSGGVQEETTFLGVPCLTLRATTERPITVTLGTNRLIEDVKNLAAESAASLQRTNRQEVELPLWDGHAGERIASILVNCHCKQ